MLFHQAGLDLNPDFSSNQLGNLDKLLNFCELQSSVSTHAKSLQLCPTLYNPMDCSPPGSSVLGILQLRLLEWVAMLFARGFSPPRDRTCFSYVSCIGRQVLYHQHHLGSPFLGRLSYYLQTVRVLLLFSPFGLFLFLFFSDCHGQYFQKYVL